MTPDHSALFEFEFDLPHGRGVSRLGGRGSHGPVVYDGAVMWRAQDTPSGPCTIRIELAARQARADFWGPGLEIACRSVPGLLGARDDPSKLIPADAVVAEWVRRFRHHRLPRTGTVWEHLVPTILGQKVPGANAARAWRSILDRWGRTPPGSPPPALRLVPQPDLVATLPYHAFHDLNIERRRAEVLIECARRAQRLEEAAHMEGPAARRRLQSIRGIGPWTASIVSQLATGDPDAVIVGDYWLPSQVVWHLAGRERGDDRDMLELLEPYRGQRGRVQALAKAAGPPPRRGARMALVDISRR